MRTASIARGLVVSLPFPVRWRMLPQPSPGLFNPAPPEFLWRCGERRKMEAIIFEIARWLSIIISIAVAVGLIHRARQYKNQSSSWWLWLAVTVCVLLVLILLVPGFVLPDL